MPGRPAKSSLKEIERGFETRRSVARAALAIYPPMAGDLAVATSPAPLKPYAAVTPGFRNTSCSSFNSAAPAAGGPWNAFRPGVRHAQPAPVLTPAVLPHP